MERTGVTALLLLWITVISVPRAEPCQRADVRHSMPSPPDYYPQAGYCKALITYEEPRAWVKDHPYEYINVRHISGPKNGDSMAVGDYRITYEFKHKDQSEKDHFTASVKVNSCPSENATASFLNGIRDCNNYCDYKSETVNGMYCTHHCNSGYELHGSPTVRCQNVRWDNPFPVCREIDCGDPKRQFTVRNGTWSYAQSTYNNRANLLCHEGFQVGGSPFTICQHSGLWLDLDYVCKDTRKPVIKNCDSMNVTTVVGLRGAAVTANFTTAITDDNSKGLVTLTYQPDQTTRFGLGVHDVILYASDPSLNTAQCQFTVTVYGKYCEELKAPANGVVHCSQLPTNIYGSQCDFSCDQGYEVYGNASLTCQISEVWDGAPPRCVEISCGQALEVDHGQVECDGLNFNDICRLNCSSGFVLNGPSTVFCQANKTWSPPGLCRDLEPPSFSEDCKDKEVFAEVLGEPTTVNWTTPQASDNSAEHVTIESDPPSGSEFPPGVTTVVVTATDTSGNRRECTFEVTVITLTCGEPGLEAANRTSDKMVYQRSVDGYVYGAVWNISCRNGYPQRGSTFITCGIVESTYPPTPMWTWPGDYYANKPACLDVVCPELNTPKNGALACFQGTSGMECLMSCNKNFTIPQQLPFGRLNCPNSRQEWLPPTAPDCTVRVRPGQSAIQTDIFYYSGSCDENIDILKKEFIERIGNIIVAADACITVPECTPANVKVTCGPIAHRRRRRSAGENFFVQFTFDLKIPFEDGAETVQNLEDVRLKLSGVLQQKVREGELDFPGLTTDEYSVGSGQVSCDCPPGTTCTIDTFSNIMSCGGCSKGLYMAEGKTECEECPVGSYQSEEMSADCIPCPPGTSTHTSASVNSTQCQEVCRPGYKSEDGFEPCLPCGPGSYQANERSTSCVPCALGSSTAQQASTAAEQCQVADLVFMDSNLNYSFSTPEATFLAWITLPLPLSTLTITLTHSTAQPSVVTFRHDGSSVVYRGSNAFPLAVNVRSDTWFHVAVTNDAASGAAKLYLNGQLMDSHPIDLPHTTALDAAVQGRVKVSRVMATNNSASASSLQTIATTCSDDVLDTSLIQMTSLPVYAIPTTCDAVDDCVSAPCGEYGSCENRPSRYVCHCRDKWTGDQCQTPPNHCQNHGCMNNATCHSGLANYTCHCPMGFIGDLCHRQIGQGNWGEWGVWSNCSQWCGGGQQQRQRNCNNPPPQPGGQDCDGEANETQSCGKPFCPVDGEWGNWTRWSECSVICGGGERTRERLCDSPPPQHGGLTCDGGNLQHEACNTHRCPVHGQWGEWAEWTQCSASCEGGTQTRHRLCDNPPPADGGNNCYGSSVQTQDCNTHECPECPSFSRISNVVRPTVVENGEEKNCTVNCLPSYSWAMHYPPQFYCSPKTNFSWSRDPDVYISMDNPQCTRGQLPEGGRMQISLLLDHSCSPGDAHLTNEVLQQVQANIAALPCSSQALHACITQVTTSCVEEPKTTTETSRRRRSTEQEARKVHIQFEMTGEAKDSNTVDFNSTEHQQYLKILKATQESVAMLTDNTNVLFSVTIDGRSVGPLSDTISMDGGYTCPPGTGERHGFCVECPTGTYAEDSLCLFCAKGQYQNVTGASSCQSCPAGYTTNIIGAYTIDQCDEPQSQPLTPGEDSGVQVGVYVGVAVASVVAAVLTVIVVTLLYKKKRVNRKLQSSMLSLNKVYPERQGE